LEVDLGQIHAGGSWEEGSKQAVDELELQSVALVGAGGLELGVVNAVDVEGNPVVGLALSEVGLALEV
jgi:hypothetical protein